MQCWGAGFGKRPEKSRWWLWGGWREDLGDTPKPGAVQGHAYFILPQQAGKVSDVLMGNLLSCGMSSLGACHV